MTSLSPSSQIVLDELACVDQPRARFSFESGRPQRKPRCGLYFASSIAMPSGTSSGADETGSSATAITGLWPSLPFALQWTPRFSVCSV